MNRLSDWSRGKDAHQHVLRYLTGHDGFGSLLIGVAALLGEFKDAECAKPLVVIPEKKYIYIYVTKLTLRGQSLVSTVSSSSFKLKTTAV